MLFKGVVNWGASSRWSFPPISAWGSIETTTMRKMLPTLVFDFSYLPVAAVGTYQVRYHEKIVKNIKSVFQRDDD